MLVVSAVSQPSVAVALQSPRPASHVNPHEPSTQVRVELGLAAHTVPHPPQLSGSVPVATSQPLVAFPSQSVKPGAHVHAQSRPEHVETAPGGGAHSQPLPGVPSQSAYPALHIVLQEPPVHTPTAFGRPRHMLPQVPQFDGSDEVLSHPSLGSPSQSMAPESHDATVHVPLAQVLVAFGSEQTAPHAPQLSRVSSRCSQPFESIPSQLAKPAMHETNVHVPLAQLPTALGKEHGEPHDPQWESDVRLASHPSAAVPLQSA